jgi:hypothetical protein
MVTWEEVFGHIGTPDEVGKEWHKLWAENEELQSEVEDLRVHNTALTLALWEAQQEARMSKLGDSQ